MSLHITSAGQYGYCDISASPINHANEAWSWCYWVRVDSDIDYHGIAALNFDASAPQTPSNRGLSVEHYWLAATNALVQEQNMGGGVNLASGLSASTWYGVAGSTLPLGSPSFQNERKVYYRTLGSPTLTLSVNDLPGSADQICNVVSVATLADGTFNLDSGYISGFRVWKRALTQAQLEAELNSPSVVDSSDLFLAWEFKTPGNLSADASGNGRVVTFVGSPQYSTEEPIAGGGGTQVAPLVISDSQFSSGESGIVITTVGGVGGFGASQGAGQVVISPTDDVNDVNAEVQSSVQAWSDTSITFTPSRGGLSLEIPLYLFVVNDDGNANADGLAVSFDPIVTVAESLVDINGDPVASETGLTVFVWLADPANGANPTTPDLTLYAETTDAGGELTFVLPPGSGLGSGDAVWLAVMKDGNPYRATLRKIIPTYS